MTPANPGDPNVICHFCGCQSPHDYTCGDCRHNFCLNCIATSTPSPSQELYCPACGSRNIRPTADPEKS